MPLTLFLSIKRRWRARRPDTHKILRLITKTSVAFSFVNGKPVFKFTNNKEEKPVIKNGEMRLGNSGEMMFLTQNGNNIVKFSKIY